MLAVALDAIVATDGEGEVWRSMDFSCSLLLCRNTSVVAVNVVDDVADDIVVAVTDGEGEAWRSVQDVNQGGWSVLMCLNTSARSDACVVSATDSLQTRPNQKVWALLWLFFSLFDC